MLKSISTLRKLAILLIEDTWMCNHTLLVTMELGIRIKKQCRNLKSSGGKVESSGGKVKSSGGKVVAYVKKQLKDISEMAKTNIKELKLGKKNK